MLNSVNRLALLYALSSPGHDGLAGNHWYFLDEVALFFGQTSKERYLTISMEFAEKDRTIINDKVIFVTNKTGYFWTDQCRRLIDFLINRDEEVVSFVAGNPIGAWFGSKENPDQHYAIAPLLFVEEGCTGTNYEKIVIHFQLRRELALLGINITDTKVSEKTALYYERNANLRKLVIKLRGAQCQICGSSFLKPDGTSYCEVHHLEGLADGGLDILENLVVLCANHHAQFHYGNVQLVSRHKDTVFIKMDGIDYRIKVG